MYIFDSRVRYSEASYNGELTIESLIDYFQDVSTFHSEDLGVGMDYLNEYHMAWVLSSWQIQVKRYPKIGEKIQACTYPYEFKGFFGMRNFLLKTTEGEVLACANSIWTLLDMEKLVPTKPTEKMLTSYVLEEKYPMEYAGRKIALVGAGDEKEAILVTKEHLDTNHHVNNGQYVRMAKYFLEDGDKVIQLRAEYRKSAKLGDTMYPCVYEEGNRRAVSLNDENGKPFAVIEFTLENQIC